MRQRGKVRHRVADMLRQRVFGIALGYEDLNDHDALRHDVALQTAAGRDGPLASAPTLCRLENRAEPWWAWLMHQVLVDVFIASFAAPPREIVLDDLPSRAAIRAWLKPSIRNAEIRYRSSEVSCRYFMCDSSGLAIG